MNATLELTTSPKTRADIIALGEGSNNAAAENAERTSYARWVEVERRRREIADQYAAGRD